MMVDQAPRIFTWQIVWSNPYRPRPDGWPEVFLQVDQERAPGQGAGPCPAVIHEAWEELHAYGYTIGLNVPSAPTRQLPEATKQRIRRRNLWKRLLKKYPMFLTTFYAEAVQARPAYYGDYDPGEFADVVFMRTTMGNLKIVKDEVQHVKG